MDDPTPRYHRAVRSLIRTHGTAFRDAKAHGDDMKWIATAALATQHVLRRFPRLSASEVARAIHDSVMHAAENSTEGVPIETIAATVAALIAARALLKTPCCRRLCPCVAAPEPPSA